MPWSAAPPPPNPSIGLPTSLPSPPPEACPGRARQGAADCVAVCSPPMAAREEHEAAAEAAFTAIGLAPKTVK